MVIFKQIVSIKKCLSTNISTDRQHQGEGASRCISNIANMSATQHSAVSPLYDCMCAGAASSARTPSCRWRGSGRRTGWMCPYHSLTCEQEMQNYSVHLISNIYYIFIGLLIKYIKINCIIDIEYS